MEYKEEYEAPAHSENQRYEVACNVILSMRLWGF